MLTADIVAEEEEEAGIVSLSWGSYFADQVVTALSLGRVQAVERDELTQQLDELAILTRGMQP